MHCDMDKKFGILIDDTLSEKTVKELLHRNGVSSSLMTELKESEDGILLNGKKVFDKNATQEEIQSTISGQIKELNKKLVAYKQIRIIEFRSTEFEKTTSRKIKRHLIK